MCCKPKGGKKMIVIMNVDYLISKRNIAEELTEKDKIYCFNKNGALVNVGILDVLKNIKAELKIIPEGEKADNITALVMASVPEPVKIYSSVDMNGLLNAVKAMQLYTGINMNITSFGISTAKGKTKKGKTEAESGDRPKRKRIVRAARSEAVSETEQKALEYNQEENSDNKKTEGFFNAAEDEISDISDRITEYCRNSKNPVLNNLDSKQVNMLKDAIEQATDSQIGLSLFLGMKFGKETALKIHEDLKPLYLMIHPDRK